MGEGHRALGIALIYGLPVKALRYVWNVCERIPFECFWELVFYEKIPPRDE